MRTTRYEQVAEYIVNLIHGGVLKEGEKIPSIRQLSNEMNVSINTIKEAYWKLEDRDYVSAVPQSGYYVKKRSNAAFDLPVDAPCHLNPQDISLCRIYGMFQDMGMHGPETSLGIAGLGSDLWPQKRIGRFIQEAVRHQGQDACNYLMPPGYLPLREQIARMGIAAGLNLSPQHIIITNGCHEAFFLALMVLCKPGDTVVFESPIYFNLLQLLQQLDLKIIEIPSSPEEGIHLDTLRFVIESHPVKAVFSISNFNNPSGFMMPTWKKKEIVRLLEEYNIPLIEDDIYGDLCFQKRPDTCKTYDTNGNVLLCSSFSKTLAPGLRVGWIAPGKYFDPVLKMKSLLNVSTASLNQIAVAKFLKMGGYERHLRKMRKQVHQNLTAMRSSILSHFPKGTRVTRPQGGLLLWVELPESINTEDIYREALKKNILIAPGILFSIRGKYSNHMRLNAGTWNEQIENAIIFLGKICARYYKTPSL